MPRKRSQVTIPAKLATTFASSERCPSTESIRTIDLTGTLKTIRSRVRENCPQAPGVYGLINSENQIVYVGMSVSLANRLQTYFTQKRARRRESRIRRAAVGLIWQPLDHGLIARIRERELIRKFRPPMNVIGHPTQLRTGYVVAIDHPVGGFEFVEELRGRHQGIWGPIPFNQWSREATEELNLHFRLRDCPKSTVLYFSGQPTPESPSTPCLRADLGTCLSPCLGQCSKTAYGRAFSRARSFLNGSAQDVVAEVETQMREAAGGKNFETAARLRDRLKAFLYLNDRLRRFHDWTNRANFVYRFNSQVNQHPQWLVVSRGVIHQLIDEPNTVDQALGILNPLNSLKARHSKPTRSNEQLRPGDFETARILFRWFRQFPNEKTSRLSYSAALRLIKRRRAG
ncbi:GIY-YIG nuclease family protein [Thalassoglobus sp. JC818]|uniref:GIY-YIG nuclease family protein n=1 Tax=Thalassoglobus sp. JC818 TaxID=3232136 RepID=UPI003458837F